MEREEKEELIKIIVSSVLLIIATFIPKTILSILFYTLSYIIISYEIYIKSFQNLKKKEIFDENLLMIIATLGAFYLKSYEEGVLVILLFQIGEFLSDLAVSKSKKSITELMDLRVEEIELEDKTTIPVEKAKIGDTFIVRPGDRIPLDGVVIKGKSFLDTSSITGESAPVEVKEEDQVISGCVNTSSILTIKATSNYQTSTAQKIIDLIEQEESKKSNTENWIHRFAKVYTPIIILIGALILIIPILLGQDGNTWLYKTLIFIVSSCPCALVISVPLGYFCGIGKASREGILIKGSKELESLSNIDYILLDKTGTITEGVMKVTNIDTKMKKKEFLQILASTEEYSLHPIAKAIKKENKEPLKKITNYKEIAGKGLSCKIDNQQILVGNQKLMEENKIEVPKIKSTGSIIYASIDNEYIGYVVISDEIKETSYRLKGIDNLVILSGDNTNIVKEVAKKLNIQEYYGELLPEDKVRIMEEYKQKGKVMFVGDGINDAPVLTKADIGVSLGNIGTDAALEASDIVLMQDDISKIKRAISISKYTHKKVIQNVVFALLIKIIVLVLGIFGISTMIMAVFADVGVTLLVVLNALLIFLHRNKEA